MQILQFRSHRGWHAVLATCLILAFQMGIATEAVASGVSATCPNGAEDIHELQSVGLSSDAPMSIVDSDQEAPPGAPMVSHGAPPCATPAPASVGVRTADDLDSRMAFPRPDRPLPTLRAEPPFQPPRTC